MPVSFSAVLALPARNADAELRYGQSPSQTARLWLPPGRGDHPLVVLVHGGCWLREFDAGHVAPLAVRLARDGYAVFVPEYRRVGEEGGGWPGTAADLARALDALVDLGHPRVVLDRALVAGHSAGGQLALWLAAREPSLFRAPLRIVAAIGLAAITDLDAYSRGANSCEAVTTRFMGGTPSQRPRDYAEASPARRSFAVPVTLLAGGRDPIVGAEQAAALPWARRVTVAEAGHFDWIHPDTAAYDVLRDALFEALGAGLAADAQR